MSSETLCRPSVVSCARSDTAKLDGRTVLTSRCTRSGAVPDRCTSDTSTKLPVLSLQYERSGAVLLHCFQLLESTQVPDKVNHTVSIHFVWGVCWYSFLHVWYMMFLVLTLLPRWAALMPVHRARANDRQMPLRPLRFCPFREGSQSAAGAIHTIHTSKRKRTEKRNLTGTSQCAKARCTQESRRVRFAWGTRVSESSTIEAEFAVPPWMFLRRQMSRGWVAKQGSATEYESIAELERESHKSVLRARPPEDTGQ